MAVRRDRLDFEAIGASGGRKVGAVLEILTFDQCVEAIRDCLDRLKTPLPEMEKQVVLVKSAAQLGKPLDQLTPTSSRSRWLTLRKPSSRHSDGATPVHRVIIDILKAVQTEFGTFSAGTYGGMSGSHASGGFQGRFRSVDMNPETPRTAAYFGKDLAFRSAEAIDTVAGRMGFTYQILSSRTAPRPAPSRATGLPAG
jgi:hypothetical protein